MKRYSILLFGKSLWMWISVCAAVIIVIIMISDVKAHSWHSGPSDSDHPTPTTQSGPSNYTSKAIVVVLAELS